MNTKDAIKEYNLRLSKTLLTGVYEAICGHVDVEVIKLFFTQNKDVKIDLNMFPKKGFRVIVDAMDHPEYKKLLPVLLENGLNLEQSLYGTGTDRTILCHLMSSCFDDSGAIQCRNIELVKFLIEEVNADIDATIEKPIYGRHNAVTDKSKKHLPVFYYLIYKYAELTRKGYGKKDLPSLVDMINLVFEKKNEKTPNFLNEQDEKGETFLHKIVKIKEQKLHIIEYPFNIETIKLLLELGVDPSVKNNDKISFYSSLKETENDDGKKLVKPCEKVIKAIKTRKMVDNATMVDVTMSI